MNTIMASVLKDIPCSGEVHELHVLLEMKAESQADAAREQAVGIQCQQLQCLCSCSQLH